MPQGISGQENVQLDSVSATCSILDRLQVSPEENAVFCAPGPRTSAGRRGRGRRGPARHVRPVRPHGGSRTRGWRDVLLCRARIAQPGRQVHQEGLRAPEHGARRTSWQHSLTLHCPVRALPSSPHWSAALHLFLPPLSPLFLVQYYNVICLLHVFTIFHFTLPVQKS